MKTGKTALIAALVATAFCSAVSVQAATRTFISSGSYINPDNWDTGVPGPADTGNVGSDLTATLDVGAGGGGSIGDTVNIGTSSGSGTLDVLSGDFTMSNLYIGATSGGDVGTVAQTGGTFTVNPSDGSALGMANNAGEVGIYDISGGSFLFNDPGDKFKLHIGQSGSATINVSGTGAVNFSGGQPQFAANTGGRAVINMDGGTWDGGRDHFFGHGDGYFELNMRAGTMDTDKINMGGGSGTSVWNVTGGTFLPKKLQTGSGTGTFELNVSGGTFEIGQDALLANGPTVKITVTGTNGSFTVDRDFLLAANATTKFELADTGVATIDLDAGDTQTFDGDLVIGLMDGASTMPCTATLITGYAGVGDEFNEVWEDGLSGDVVYDTGNNEVRIENVIPEPASMGLMAAGLAGVLWYRRRKSLRAG